MGQFSGWAWGWITATCSDHYYDGPETGWPTVYTTVCAYTADMANYDGDSGGPLFTWEGGDEVSLEGTVIGQTNTQNEVFSKLSRIFSDFGGNWVVTRDGPIPPLTVSINGPSQVKPNQTTCTWSAQASGGYLPYTTYAWTKNFNPVGTNSAALQLSSTGTTSFTLRVTVTDGTGAQATGSKSVTVSSSAPTCPL